MRNFFAFIPLPFSRLVFIPEYRKQKCHELSTLVYGQDDRQTDICRDDNPTGNIMNAFGQNELNENLNKFHLSKYDIFVYSVVCIRIFILTFFFVRFLSNLTFSIWILSPFAFNIQRNYIVSLCEISFERHDKKKRIKFCGGGFHFLFASALAPFSFTAGECQSDYMFIYLFVILWWKVRQPKEKPLSSSTWDEHECLFFSSSAECVFDSLLTFYAIASCDEQQFS